MREIKFRVWSRHYKEFWYVDFGQEFELKREPENILMQFTGLHDKNGKEIYEGDIYKVPNGDIGVIEYEESRFVLNCPTGKWSRKYVYWHGGMPHSADWVVIANIYENPELLKKEVVTLSVYGNCSQCGAELRQSGSSLVCLHGHYQPW